MSKGVKLLEMVKNAIRNKIPFDYLLVDSWFTCTELVNFVYRRHKKFHLLAMAKMSNTKYSVYGKLHNAMELIALYEGNPQFCHNCRRYKCHYIALRGKLGVNLYAYSL